MILRSGIFLLAITIIELATAVNLRADEPPSNAATELLRKYLAIRTDHPDHGTEEAALFWLREAQREEIEGATWSIDPSRRCVHFVAYLPSSVPAVQSPLMLVHHADTVPAVEAEWSTPPFEPTWVREKTDWSLHARGAIDDKGHGVAHWMALKKLRDSSTPRTRDLYFVMNCGEEVSDPLGAVSFVHFLIRPLENMPQVNFELTTVEKLETAKLMKRFRSLGKVEWIWNEGSFGSKTEVAPYTLLPVATSQKGLWAGQVSVEGPGGHSALSSSKTPLEALVRGLKNLYDENRSWSHKTKSLHFEMQELVRTVGSVRPFYERLLLKLYPRFFFEIFGMQTMVTSWWQANSPVSPDASVNSFTRTLPNIVRSRTSSLIEYRFLGDKTAFEIENHLKTVFGAEVSDPLKFHVETSEYIPFRRDFFSGVEADVFTEILGSYPKVLVTPFISPGITDSRFFRMAGVRAFDLVPFFLNRDEIRSMHGKDERLAYQELMRGIDIEVAILEKLVR